jgi:isoleucyl-tRNA synthetase
MDTARVVTSLGRSARADAKLGVRQPLARAIVSLPAGTELRADVTHEVESELNVKRLEPVDSLEGLLTYHVVPNFKALGPRVGKLLPALKTVLADLDGNEVQRTLADAGSLRVSVDGTEIELGPDDVEVRAEKHEELSLVQGNGVAVALDLRLDNELRAEGIARELVRAVNDARKQHGFAIADRISCTITTTGAVAAAARRHADYIATEVLATRFDVADVTLAAADLTIDGLGVALDLSADA